MIKKIATLHSLKGWLIAFGLLGIAMVLLPLLNIFVPEESVLHVPDYMFSLLGKYLCYALVALAVDLIWGYTGILSLGHGVFFSMGGYAMGMYLMRSIGKEGVYKNDLPDFMVFLDWKELPWYWYGFDYFAFTLLVILILPGLFAFTFGYFAFKSRIKGVYFAIITQAMTYALMLLFFRNETGFGGNNGLTDFKRILGYSLQEPSTKMSLYIITIIVLFLSYVLSRYVVQSKLGRVLTAIRDAESRVMFSGYNTLHYKLFVWTLSAFLCGIAGALYVPQVGIINPSEMQPSNSIEMAIWVAVGGRGTLSGALVGAGLVNGAKSWFTVAAPDYWLYFLGTLFIVLTLFFPKGLVGVFSRFSSKDKARGPS
ncbi:MAG TPA: urea ABC transporter permease subunit UrtC [Nitrospina sp.]|jgi:urea transport system permease protein|nr:urea ABC transporter permease subunit UrtC [Nitrospinota bacterium]MDP6334649.1 urea ABC transporter permease subunit UrtC [Nitrospinaceae bacterium]MDP7148153.1 urea ABC transporter permease subunit UrtC [Nitrospinaceae bacterium]HAX45601.1 urea ABC transporter permease subunit UrtC [Nitrospina sp.]|tara:strand:+ start:3615 stop:4721 length:1107 start_codon:yes stop_codon:yes gene_type:complete